MNINKYHYQQIMIVKVSRYRNIGKDVLVKSYKHQLKDQSESYMGYIVQRVGLRWLYIYMCCMEDQDDKKSTIYFMQYENRTVL